MEQEMMLMELDMNLLFESHWDQAGIKVGLEVNSIPVQEGPGWVDHLKPAVLGFTDKESCY